MKEILKKFFRFLREIIDVVGLGNVFIILFVVWFVRSPLWLRLRVFLGLASERETSAVKADISAVNDEVMDRWSNGVSDSTNPLLTSTQRSIAWQYYLRGCKEKGLISFWKYWGLFALPDWTISDSMIEKYKNLYLYGVDSDSK